MSALPVRGPGRFQWSAGGWFGSQLGSTLWMLLGAVLLLGAGRTSGLVPLACFVAANAIGGLLWRARTRVAPFPAVQVLLAVVGVCGLVALTAMTRDVPDAGRYYRALLLIPGLMLLFLWMERSARRSSPHSSPGPSER